MCAILAAGGIFYYFSAQQARAVRVAEVLTSLDPAQSGALALSPHRDPSLPARLLWTRMGLADPADPQPLFPNLAFFRLALLAGFDLPRAQSVTLRLASDDGLRVKLDGLTVYDAWNIHRERRDVLDLELGPGLHLLEVDYFQAQGAAVLSLRLTGPKGRPIAMHPPGPDFGVAAWQKLAFACKEFTFRAKALGLLALLWLFAGLAWVLAGPLPVWLRRLAPAAHPPPAIPPPEPRDWLIPSLIFAAFALLMLGAMAWQGAELPRTILLGKWDESWYRRIMLRGYYLDLDFPLYFKGSVSWFPLLSWLARPLYWAGVHPWWATLLTAWLAALTGFHLFYRIMRALFGRAAAVWTLVFLAAYPCSFYLLLGYPYGLALCLGLGYFWCLNAGHYWPAVGLGILAGLSYPLAAAVAILPPFLLLPRVLRADDPWPLLRALVLTAAAPAVGVAILFTHHWLIFGDFWAYFDSQIGWGRRLDWPWTALYRHLAGASWRDPLNLALLLWLGGAMLFIHRFSSTLWALLGAVFWLNHATGSLMSNFRQYLAAWPWFAMLGSSPRPAWLKVAWAAGMLWLFWHDFLPTWLARHLM